MALTRSTPLQLYWNISKLSRQPAVIGFRNYSTDDFKSILDRIGDNLSQGMGSNPPKGENSSLKWENNNSRSFDNEDGGNQKGGFRQGGFSSNNRFGGGNRGFSNQNQGGYNQRGQGGFGGQGGYGGQGGFGGGGGRFGQPGGQGFGGRNSMPTLNPLDWNGVQLAKVVKNCYKEHPSVTNMPKEDVAAFRQKSKITTKGNDIPNPVFEFENTSFPQEIIDVLKSEYKTPTPIQSQGWPVALSGRDMVGSSQTGSGKTVGFLLPALVHIMTQISHTPHKWTDGPIAVVLAPTRELAVQIMDEARPFLPKLGLRATAVYGGSPKPPQALSLKQGPHLVVATPGRLIDMLEEGHTNLRRCTYIVLDEADRMLDMGFEPQIRSILSQVRPDRQTLMWSATWPDKIQKLANEFFKDPVTIHVGSTELSANPNVKQHVHVVEGAQKDEKILALVKQLMEEHSKPKILIFAGTQGGADRLCYGLQSEGMRSVGSIHGGKQQHARQAVLNMFRNGRTNILVATDVAARGLDIDDVSHVINYDFPKQIEDYIHRIGRTGRAGRLGTSHSFFTPDIISLKLLPELLDVMRTAGQEVSQEMLQLHQQSFGFRGNRFGGSFGGGGNRFGNRQGGNRFGGENRFGSGGGNRFGGNRDGGNRDGGFNNNNQRQNLQQSKQDKDDFLSEDNFRDSRSASRSGGSKSRSQDDIDEDWDMEDEYDNRKGGRR